MYHSENNLDILKSLEKLFSTGVLGCYTSITIKNYIYDPVLQFSVALIFIKKYFVVCFFYYELIAHKERINLIFYLTNHITI